MSFGASCASRRRLLAEARHAHGGRFGAAQSEGRAADAHHQRIAGRPHARDDFAARAGHESEIAQSRQQDRAAATSVIESGDFREPGHERGLAAAQVGERNGRDAASGIGRFHEPKYGVEASRM